MAAELTWIPSWPLAGHRLTLYAPKWGAETVQAVFERLQAAKESGALPPWMTESRYGWPVLEWRDRAEVYLQGVWTEERS